MSSIESVEYVDVHVKCEFTFSGNVTYMSMNRTEVNISVFHQQNWQGAT